MCVLIERSSSRAMASDSAAPSRSCGSTSTVSWVIRPGWVSTHWKYGDRRGSASTNSSIWVGNTLTPRTIIMSSVRPVIFCIRRIEGTAVPGNSRVRSRVR